MSNTCRRNNNVITSRIPFQEYIIVLSKILLGKADTMIWGINLSYFYNENKPKMS